MAKTIRRNSKEFARVTDTQVFKLFTLENNFSGEEVEGKISCYSKKNGVLTKHENHYRLRLHSNYWIDIPA